MSDDEVLAILSNLDTRKLSTRFISQNQDLNTPTARILLNIILIAVVSAFLKHTYIIALEGTTKIECTLTLYEKGFFGNYTQVSQVSETYNGPRHEFVGYYAIKSGTTYKLNTTAKVTRNGVTETVSTDFEKRC